ncbi:MAG TPA: DMT family transporter [Acidimicrobiales bacterium]|nr:DMT family transporter [Acidimicrobiales bacterium]
MVLAVVCALVSSLLYALASVLQHRAAIAQPRSTSMRLGLLSRLARNPMWLLGIGFDGGAYALQFIALGHGALVLVQPLLVCGLLFALPLGAWLAGGRMTSRDWGGAAAVVVGLSAFLLTASPGKGHAEVANRDWLILFLVTAVTIGMLLAASRRGGNRTRAGLLAAAAGINYGVTAALTKAAAHLLAGGVLELFESWEVYVLVAAGLLGMLMAQSAFQAGDLDASLPVLTVVDPVVSIMIGAFLLGEGVRSGPVATTIEVLGLILMTVGVFALSKAEVVRAVLDEKAETP